MRIVFLLLSLIAAVSAQTTWYIQGVVNTPVANSGWNIASTATGTPAVNPNITVNAGQTITFVLLGAFPAHPFGFTSKIDATDLSVESDFGETPANCTAGPANAYVTSNTTFPCTITLTVPADSASAPYYYKCTNHVAMRGFVNVVAAAPTTAAPSGTPTTTPAPTTPPTKTNNSASVSMPALTTIVLAAAAAVIVA